MTFMIQKKNVKGVTARKSNRSQNENPAFNRFNELKDEFYKITNINLFNFIDTLLFKMGIITIDVLAFDDFILRKYGDYMKDRLSMSDFIRLKFGDRAVEIIEKMIDNITEDYDSTDKQ